MEDGFIPTEGQILNEHPHPTIGKFRKWFRASVDLMSDWRKEALEDYDFVSGKQWTNDEKWTFEDKVYVKKPLPHFFFCDISR